MEAKDTVIQLKAVPKQIFEGKEDTIDTKMAYIAGWKDSTEAQAEISFKAGEDKGYSNGYTDGYNRAKQEAVQSMLEHSGEARQAGIKEVVEAVKGMFIGSTWGTDILKLDGNKWQVFLKEKGIK